MSAIKIVFTLTLISVVQSQKQFEPFVIEGDFADIQDYSYSVCLAVTCVNTYGRKSFLCGASILNQVIVLTAAHCIHNCLLTTSHIAVRVGSEHRDGTFRTSAADYRTHAKYHELSASNDIALIKTKMPLYFNKKISRVVLLRSPPQNEIAFVAGWGLVDNDKEIGTKLLKYLRQRVFTRPQCMQQMGEIPKGSFCAGIKSGKKCTAKGDSGSALVIRGFIQIGLVSYTSPTFSINLAVYTDTAYFYDWIRDNTADLLCSSM